MIEKRYNFYIDECGVYYYICDEKEILAEAFYRDDAETLVNQLNEQEERIEELEQEIDIKNDLIQQQRNELNTDPYKTAHKYRKEFMRVCEDLADANLTIKKLKCDERR